MTTRRPFWQRHVSVEIEGLTVTEPKIDFNVRRKVAGEPPTGTILIYNLSPDTQQQIKERDQSVVLDAGYSDFQATIFTGISQKVERDRENLSGLTRITLTGMAQRELNAPHTNQTWADTDLHTIIAQYVSDMGLNLGSLADVPNPSIDYWYAAEPSKSGLTRLLEAHDMSWYEETDFVRINQQAMAQAGTGLIVLNKNTGLIDRPTETDKGARARALLLPQMRLGNQIQLESEYISGLWKVVGLEHKGTNWVPGDFFSDMELREI